MTAIQHKPKTQSLHNQDRDSFCNKLSGQESNLEDSRTPTLEPHSFHPEPQSTPFSISDIALGRSASLSDLPILKKYSVESTDRGQHKNTIRSIPDPTAIKKMQMHLMSISRKRSRFKLCQDKSVMREPIHQNAQPVH
jgi:hypothetical protein